MKACFICGIKTEEFERNGKVCQWYTKSYIDH